MSLERKQKLMRKQNIDFELFLLLDFSNCVKNEPKIKWKRNFHSLKSNLHHFMKLKLLLKLQSRAQLYLFFIRFNF